MTDDGAATAAGKPPAPKGPTVSDRSPSNADEHPESGGDIQTYIGERLRRAFDDIAKQPVPDRFVQLMKELDRS